MFFHIGLQFARMDSSWRWDIFKDVLIGGIETSHPSSRASIVIPNLSLSKNQDINLIRRIFYQRCAQEGFPVLLGEEGVGVNGALLTLQSPLSRSWAFLEMWILSLFFNLIFLFTSRSKACHTHISKSQHKSQKNWTGATSSQVIHEERQQMRIVGEFQHCPLLNAW